MVCNCDEECTCYDEGYGVAMGLNPALPVSVELVSFSQLPEHFDKRVTTEIAVYSFALAFRIDIGYRDSYNFADVARLYNMDDAARKERDV